MFFIFSLKLYAQSKYLKLDSKNGLPNELVYSSVMDSDQVAWFGTDGGLVKYDGIKYKFYTKNDGLPNTSLISLDILGKNHLAIGSFNGLIEFKNNEFKFIDENRYTVVNLFSNEKYIFYITGAYELFIFDRKKRVTKNYNIDNERFYRVNRFKNGFIAVSEIGVHLFDENLNVKLIKPEGFEEKKYSYISSYKEYFVISNLKKTYMYKNDSLIKIVDFEDYIEEEITRVHIDSKLNIWISENLPSQTIFKYDHSKVIPINSIINSRQIINSFYEDNAGNIHLNTYGNGVFILKNNNNYQITNEDDLENTITTDFYQSSNKLNIILNSNGFYYYNSNNQINKSKLNYFHSNSLNYYYNISEYVNGYILSCSTPISKINDYKKINIENDIFYIFSSSYIYYDSISKLLINDFYGNRISFFKVNNDGTYKEVKKYVNESYRNKVQNITKINNKYFISTNNGLGILDSALHFKLHYKNNSFKQLFEMNGTYYIIMNDGLFSYKENYLYKVSYFDGIPVQNITQIDNQIFVSTNQGLYIIHKPTKKIIRLHDKNELISNQTVKVRSFNDMLYVITKKGINAFDKKYFNNLFYHSSNSKNIFRYIKVDDFLTYTNKEISIERNTNSIGIYFSPNDLMSSYYIRYSVDNHPWIYENLNTRSIVLNTLESGLHQIKVQHSLNNITWEDSFTIKYKKELYFYETTWFTIIVFTISILLIGAIIFYYFKTRNKKLSKKFKIQHEISELKMHALNAAINSHFIYNVLSAIQYFVRSKQLENASTFLAYFAKLIRITVDNSDNSFISLKQELERIELYLKLERLRLDNRLDYIIDIDPTISTSISVPNMLILPFIENAILHGIVPSEKQGLITIQLKRIDHEFVEISIDDNGVGIQSVKSNNVNKRSIGLENVKKRLSLFASTEESVKIINKSDRDPSITGVKVSFNIPIIHHNS